MGAKCMSHHATQVDGLVSVSECALYMLPLDSDVFSLQMSSAYADVAIHGDATSGVFRVV